MLISIFSHQRAAIRPRTLDHTPSYPAGQVGQLVIPLKPGPGEALPGFPDRCGWLSRRPASPDRFPVLMGR